MSVYILCESTQRKGKKNDEEVEVLATTFHSSDEEHGAVEPGGFDEYQNNTIKIWLSVFALQKPCLALLHHFELCA